MYGLAIAVLVVLSEALCGVGAQEKPKTDQKYDVKRCTPKVGNSTQAGKHKLGPIRVREGEKPTGYLPVIALEILETGEVVNARVKRTSGIADEDAAALKWVRAFRHNARPGCGVIETEESVGIEYF